MVGIILAAGNGKRLLPITLVVNKELLPVGDKPVIYYPLSMLVASGIKRIVIVINPKDGNQIKTMVKSFKPPKKIDIKFAVQTKPLGMPDAISKAKRYVGKDSIIMVGGDNIFGKAYTRYIKNFKKGEIAFLRKVRDPRKFAVPVYDKSGRLTSLLEKPKTVKGKWAVCGPNIFDNDIFGFIETLKPSARGELEIVDLHKIYLKNNSLKLIKTNDFWADVGNFEDLAITSYKISTRRISFNYDNF